MTKKLIASVFTIIGMLFLFILQTVFGAEVTEFWNTEIRPSIVQNGWEWVFSVIEFTASFWGGVLTALILVLVVERTVARLVADTQYPSTTQRPETRLRIRLDPNGTAIEEINQNIIWQQTIVGVDTISNNIKANSGQLFRGDTISIAFAEPIDYERPIVETFGHTAKLSGSYPLSRNGYVFVFLDGLPPVLDIYFPKPRYYEQKSIENVSSKSSSASGDNGKKSDSNFTEATTTSP
ncbi:MAG: hypothetical protein AAGA53_15870 [Pseudomonadota bacterium]